MDNLLEFVGDFIDENPTLVMGLFVFLAVATLAFVAMAALRVRSEVKRRAADVMLDNSGRSDDKRSLRHASRMAAQKLIDYTTRNYSADGGDQRQLRRRLIQAGFLDSRAVAYFFFGRIVLALGFAAMAFSLSPMIFDELSTMAWISVWVAAMLGYFGPNLYINRRIKVRQVEHRAGFPDFMDLLVVCAEAGLSMEAALDRVGRELSDSYPSLSANSYMTTLEMRAGRTLGEALEHFGDRLGLEEARSFATLLQQSEELGSSMTDALRVYSDEMRHKRMSRAEEKAYSLPARLSVPLMVCIFPVILIVIMLPVVVRVKIGGY